MHKDKPLKLINQFKFISEIYNNIPISYINMYFTLMIHNGKKLMRIFLKKKYLLIFNQFFLKLKTSILHILLIYDLSKLQFKYIEEENVNLN